MIMNKCRLLLISLTYNHLNLDIKELHKELLHSLFVIHVLLFLSYFSRLHGSYQRLDFGHVTDALVDFTGGVAETYELNIDEDDENRQLSHLMETMSNELSNHSIICLKINVSYLMLFLTASVS